MGVSSVSIVRPCRIILSSRFWLDELGKGDMVDDAVG